MRHRRRRGIAIIISLMMMVLVIMFVTAMVVTFPTTMESARNSQEGRLALAAAQSGVDYAWCRLQERPSWRGDGTGNAALTTINTSNLVVQEDRGDVWGFINDSGGNRSQFRIRFNWHDGTGGADALSNPSSLYTIPSQFISFNNLDKSTPAPVYRGNVNSTAAPNPTSAPHPYDIAQYSCCVLVEGLAGKGLSNTSSSAPLPGSNAGRVVRQTLEIDLGRPSLANLDSAIYGGGSINPSGPGQILDVQSNGAALPRTRTLQRVSPSGGAKYKTTAGGSIVASDTSFTSVASTGPAPTITHESIGLQRKKWLAVKMADITQADPLVDPKLPAGTYVWKRNGDLEYYKEEYAGAIPTSSPTVIHNTGDLNALMGVSSSPIVMDGSTYTLQITNNVYVNPQTGGAGPVKSLAIIPEPDIAVLDADRPKTLFGSTSGNAPVLTGSSDITLKGSMIGKGSVTSTGNIKFQGASVFETDPGKNVAIYASGNITMEAIPPEVALNLNPSNASSTGHHHSLHHRHHHHYNYSGMANTLSVNTSALIPNRLGALDGNDVMIAGLVYAGGNFTTALGTGTMYLRGALVAYGGNVETGEPAGTSGGDVNVDSKGAQFVFDPNYVVSSMSLSAPSRLVRSLQNLY